MRGQGSYTCEPMRNVVEVLSGQQTPAFAKVCVKGFSLQNLSHRSFSIVTVEKTLDMLASSEEERDAWVGLLQRSAGFI